MQAAVFVNKNVSTPVVSKFLANLQSNIQAGKAVSDIVRSTLGPKAMLKMLLAFVIRTNLRIRLNG